MIGRLLKNRLWGIALLVMALWNVTSCAGPSSSLINREERVETGVQAPANFDVTAVDLEIFEGLPVGFTEEGYPFRGNPEAPVTLVEFSDFLCPFCGRYFNQTLPTLLDTYGTSGQVKFVFHDFPLVALHPTAVAGHAAAHCAGEQGALQYWEMHDELFTGQQQWSHLGDPSQYLTGVAESIGLDMEAYNTCINGGETQKLVDERVAEGHELGFRGTPTFQLVSNATGQVSPLVGAQPLTSFTGAIAGILGGEGGTSVASAAEASVDPEKAVKVSFDVEGLDLETYQGMPVGFTEEGYPFRGNPEAELTLVEFSDYLCPFCGRHFNSTYPQLIQTYGAGGEVNFVFRDLPLTSLHPTAPVGHAGALCVAEQGAALFWEMHDQLFATQGQWANLPDPSQFVAGLADGIGADMKAYDECIAAGETSTLVNEQVAAGQALGFTGTPTFQVLVNESAQIYPVTGAQPLQVFADLLDTLLAGEKPEIAEEPDPAELPYWANADGLTPDPERPGFTLAGDPYKGNPEAAVVVVEFADFQCPACGQHALEIQPALDEQLVDTGQIMWVFKNLPLKEHPQALVAATAAECAGEQGRFWEMHHQLFETMELWATDDVEVQMIDLADQLGLDMANFSICFNSRAALEHVIADMYDAQGVTETTPAFVVLKDGRGRFLNGSRPVDSFVTILQSTLAPGDDNG